MPAAPSHVATRSGADFAVADIAANRALDNRLVATYAAAVRAGGEVNGKPIGVLGIFLNRRNVILMLMAIELLLLSVNINLVAFSAYLGDMKGQIFAMFVLTVAAAEAAIGLAILVIFFRRRGTIAVDAADQMRG